MEVVTAVATESTRSIPFAPFVDLLPDGPTQDRLQVLSTALSTLRARAGDRGLLLAVDDAHQLDMGSLALLINAASSNQATVCLTARTAEPMTVDLVDLWTNGVIERIDLQPLNRAGSRSLTHSVMGDIDPELDEELWRLAAGNPLLLHELIEGSVGQTIERDDRGVWRRRGELTESARLSDLVTSRLMSLPEHLQSSMDIVAVGAPLPTRLLREVIGDDITELEARRLVSTVELGGSTMAVVGHPLYGEILQVNLGDLRRQNAYLAGRRVTDGGRRDRQPQGRGLAAGLRRRHITRSRRSRRLGRTRSS